MPVTVASVEQPRIQSTFILAEEHLKVRIIEVLVLCERLVLVFQYF